MTEEYVTVEGARLWTARTGSGAPLVLLHGGPGLWDNLHGLAAMLDARFEVTRYDQRGCGRSERVGPYSIEQSVGDLEALRAHGGHARWVIGGHSYGVSLALAYAVTHPERVETLLLESGTGVDLDWREEYHAERERRRTQAQRERLTLLGALRGTNQWSEDLDRESCALTWAPDFASRHRDAERAAEMWRAPGPNYEANRETNADWRRLLDSGFADRVAHLDIPTLVIHGREDPRPWSAAQRLADRLPQGRLELIDGAGHFPWLEQPDAMRKALAGFLDDL